VILPRNAQIQIRPGVMIDRLGSMICGMVRALRGLLAENI
jgi:hypothetical protein